MDESDHCALSLFLSKDVSIRGYICPVRRTYNHLTYFEEKESMRSETQYKLLRFDVLTPKLPRLTRFTDLKFEIEYS